MTTATLPLSPADRLAHDLASYVRRRPAAVAAEDHGKTKDPQLPSRPRGPHPYPTGVA